MPDFEFSVTALERGTLMKLRRAERTAQYFLTNEQADHRVVGPALKALGDELAGSAGALQMSAPDLSPNGLAKRAQEVAENRIRILFRAAQKAIPQARDDLSRRREVFALPRFPDHQPLAVRIEQRQFARGLSLPKLIDHISRDPTLAAAIVEGGLAMSGLPEDIFDRLKRDIAVSNATLVLAGQRDFQTIADAEDPIGGAPDIAAARAAGEELISAHEAEAVILDEAPSALKYAIDMVAVLTDTDRQSAFRLLAA